MTPSKYQIAAYNAYQNTSNHILISAVAGSGKTKTLCKLMELTPPDKTLMYVAFNKHTVEELKPKVPNTPNLTIGTLHSRGYQSICMNHRGKFKLDDWKTFKVCRKVASSWKDVPKNKLNTKIYNLAEFYNFYRLTNQTDLSDFENLVNKYGLNVDRSDLPKIKQILWEMEGYNTNHQNEKDFIIDFIDMIYLPVFLNFTVKQVDILLIDEAQDLSNIQHQFIGKLLKQNGRIVAVGDQYQQIYSFAGSDLDSWDKFKMLSGVIELPLSYCYRCGTKITEKANTVHNIMESPENHFEGEVIENGNLLYAKTGDFIICRNTKPLVDLYFYFLEREQAAFIKGSDIGRNLVKVIEPFKNEDSITLYKEMEKELNGIYAFLVTHGVVSPQRHQKYINYKEKLDIIKVFASRYKTAKEIILVIERIFEENGKGIMLSTIHKAKGLENDIVYFYLPSLIPSKYAEQPWEIEQEHNLMYVAITRAKKKLIFVNEAN